MKKIILVTALAVNFQALAAPTFDLTSNTFVFTEVTTSKSQAYEAGINTLQQMKLLSSNQAYQKLNIENDNTAKGEAKIDDGRVFVDEFAEADGSIKYQARVKLTYSYNESGNNR